MLHSPKTISRSLAKKLTFAALILCIYLFSLLLITWNFFASRPAFLLPSIVLLAAFGLVAFYVAVKKTVRRHVAEPLLRLSSLTDEVVSGNYQAFADVSGANEIGYLGRNLNFMIDVICRQTIDLEQAVEDREAALKKADENVRLLREELLEAAGIGERYNGIISQDLRTKAGLMLIYAKFLSESAEIGNDSPTSAFARKMTDVAYDLMAVISEMTDVGELTGARPGIRPCRCDFGGIIDGSLELFKPLITFKKINISREFAPEISSVVIDRDKIRQVVNNLVGNAVKFSEPEGNVRIVAGCEGDGVCFEIHDCGQGMTEEQQEKIFSDESFDACTPGTAGEIGFGSGLKIARFFAELQGGSLRFESRRGKGSSFFFKIPQGKIE